MNPPANWYPDPLGHHEQRYWDGDQWTEHVFTAGVQGVDPLVVSGDDEALDDAVAVAATTEATAVSEDVDLFDEHDGAATSTNGSADVEDPSEQAVAREDATVGAASGGSGFAGDTFVMSSDTVNRLVPRGTGDAGDQSAAPAPSADEPSVDEPPVSHEEDDLQRPQGSAPASDEATETPETEDAGEEQSDESAEALGDERTGDAPPHDETAHHAEEPADEEERPAPSPDEAAPPQAGDLLDATPPVGSAPVAAVPAFDETATAEPEGTAASEPDGSQDTNDEPQPDLPTDHAPQPTQDDPTPVPALGGLRGALVEGSYAEREGSEPASLQNTRLLRCRLDGGSEIVARQGTMVAFQGDVSFRRQGAGGVGRALKRAATGEGLAMMRVAGSGDVFFADGAQHVFLLQLDGGPGLSVNGRNVLAFSADLAWDIERVRGASLLSGGLFNTTLTGTGWVALVSDGEPVVLRTDGAPTYVDVNALVAWSAGLTTRVVSSVSAASVVGLGSGEAFQMAFEGDGVAIVQPSEGWSQNGLGG